MRIGDILEIFGEKWVVALDKSTKKYKLFELWTKEGKRMSYTEVKNEYKS